MKSALHFLKPAATDLPIGFTKYQCYVGIKHLQAEMSDFGVRGLELGESDAHVYLILPGGT